MASRFIFSVRQLSVSVSLSQNFISNSSRIRLYHFSQPISFNSGNIFFGWKLHHLAQLPRTRCLTFTVQTHESAGFDTNIRQSIVTKRKSLFFLSVRIYNAQLQFLWDTLYFPIKIQTCCHCPIDTHMKSKCNWHSREI